MFEGGIPGFIAALVDPDWRQKARRRRNGDPMKLDPERAAYWQRRAEEYLEGAIADTDMEEEGW